MGVYTSEVGDNSDLVASIVSLYLKDGDVIADVTYGKGVFWRKVDLGRFSFHPSDLLTCENKYDFCNLPYEDESFDCVVLDPPYCHNPGKMIVDPNYRNAETTKGMYHDDIIQLYRDGMTEANRILKVGGQLWVKCKDEVESGYQRWSHVELYDAAISLGLYGRDLFVMTQKAKPVIQHRNQRHARKNHSFMWIFQKPTEKQTKTLKRHKIL